MYVVTIRVEETNSQGRTVRYSTTETKTNLRETLQHIRKLDADEGVRLAKHGINGTRRTTLIFHGKLD